MMKKLTKGNEAIGRGALAAGCRFYFGYPITPQNDIPEFLSAELPKIGGEFLQAESEIAAINMILGVAASGKRAMTSSSGPGLSLKQEGISYMAGSELPAVIINISRSGPGLGGISPSQGDYFQATRGGGHGDYRTIVYAPASCQESYELTYKAFEKADKYRNPVLILGDSVIGQMKEPVDFNLPEIDPTELTIPDWAVTGKQGRDKQNIVKSLFLGPHELAAHVTHLKEKYDEIEANEIRFEERDIEDAELIVVAFGSASRMCKTSVDLARAKGLKVGLFRPITLWPFPLAQIEKRAEKTKKFLTVELNVGQMVEDVERAVRGKAEVLLYGRPPGANSLPTPDEILEKIESVY
jgi:2-oxoglutarate/2-oxoacid ferredoxin oxidoreductase subunit alpha